MTEPANVLLTKLALPLRPADALDLPSDTDVYPQHRVDFVYFPLTAAVSILYGGREAATICSEGMVGSTVLLGADEPLGQHVVVMPGLAVRVPLAIFRQSIHESPGRRAILNRYLAAFLAQLLQVAACGRLHTIKQQCARWLLNAQDCTTAAELVISQEHLAQLFGVRRATINPPLIALQRDGAIRYRRGKLTISDRQQLTTAACECYRLIAARHGRLDSTGATCQGSTQRQSNVT
jgi:Crp-like helix-turn-helix protein